MESLQAPAPYKAKKYTIEQIDEHLHFIAEIIKYGRKANRGDCFVQADKWLDRRNELTQQPGALS